MGLFKDLQNSAATGQAATKAAPLMAEAQTLALQSDVHLNDPMWAPVEGIDCDSYARIMAGLLKDGVAGPEAVNAYAEAHGVPEGRWHAVQLGWNERMTQHMAVRTRYGTLYSHLST